jgi:hypothetical protein
VRSELERGDAILDAGQAVAAQQRRSATAVVGDHDRDVVVDGDVDVRLGRGRSSRRGRQAGSRGR